MLFDDSKNGWVGDDSKTTVALWSLVSTGASTQHLKASQEIEQR
jgi:hypothetical protein